MNDDKKKIVDLDLSDPKYKNSPSINELKVLNKKPEGDLTAREKKIRDKANSEFKSTIDKLVDGFNLPSIVDNRIDLPIPVIEPKPTLAEQRKQTNALIELLELNKVKDADMHTAIQPSLDTEDHILYFSNKPVQFTPDNDMYKICKKLFYRGAPVKKPVEIGDLFDVLDTEGKTIVQKKKKVYHLISTLNNKVGIDTKTGITDLFVVDKRVWFNKKFM